MEAREHWRTRDPLLYAVTPEQPVERLMEAMPTAFGALVRAIVHQQVSIAAGRSIATRLVAACGGEAEPARVLALSEADLQAAGLSRGKIRYVRALAEGASDGLLTDIEAQSEEEIERRLVLLPGIGVWTAKMFLLFHVRRLDVFAGGDLGLREGIEVLDGMSGPLTIAEAEARATAWSPYRSVASVVLWDLLRRTRLEGRAPRRRVTRSGPANGAGPGEDAQGVTT